MTKNKQHADAAAPDSISGDLGLLAQAVADAFRGLSPATKLESRWSRLRECGRSFGSGC